MTTTGGLLLDSPAARPCTHRRPHEHGTVQRYTRDRCRCQSCRAAKHAYTSHRTQQIVYGRWNAWVDARPVRAHVLDVMQETGMGWRAVADRAHLAPTTVRQLLHGINGGPPSSRVQRKTADALYALGAGPHRPPPRPALWGHDP